MIKKIFLDFMPIIVFLSAVSIANDADHKEGDSLVDSGTFTVKRSDKKPSASRAVVQPRKIDPQPEETESAYRLGRSHSNPLKKSSSLPSSLSSATTKEYMFDPEKTDSASEDRPHKKIKKPSMFGTLKRSLSSVQLSGKKIAPSSSHLEKRGKGRPQIDITKDPALHLMLNPNEPTGLNVPQVSLCMCQDRRERGVSNSFAMTISNYVDTASQYGDVVNSTDMFTKAAQEGTAGMRVKLLAAGLTPENLDALKRNEDDLLGRLRGTAQYNELTRKCMLPE